MQVSEVRVANMLMDRRFPKSLKHRDGEGGGFGAHVLWGRDVSAHGGFRGVPEVWGGGRGTAHFSCNFREVDSWVRLPHVTCPGKQYSLGCFL